MNKIIIKDLEAFAHHGVFKEEKTLGQKFLICLELELDTRAAAKSCDLQKSVHYGELSHRVLEEFARESYDLLETVAENLAEFILLEYNLVKAVKVTVKKPWAPILRSLDTVSIEICRKWHRVYISLGSNLGNKEENLNNALKLMEDSNYINILKVSNFIKTEPWGYENQDEFLNGVCEIKTLLSPKELVKFLLNIEAELKRERTIKWGPRTIDLDVLLYDDMITEDEEILIPHPRMHLRRFVMEPLTEIAPYVFHPVLRKRNYEILEALLG
ncbi:dihydroneopterin aldolase / 2-amino-4-hydroxy-6-hydroxymethyldihydropteridine diphosphokinase [Clostridium cavendishii DSM 21758]|uniref:Bifunctional folate synthesis protein n=1 Tax=Clostridium cavendishii DSM 21758 TaxID=1121302 RepID=A0A1M6EW66_9CLOT|nr:2-amino-4-hydroxy-6-hydroxymethyldihydropteridine diphosphokinase [Clostridium cavendishii]SHI89685.1 dihydroneopterin aldolase / 2-amino-4-hydroxy-6-hydroxymethyldihydropteridine diphosphokinase [Clostridium cavendishii DSM 21758]